MYAIIETGGKQYKVNQNDRLKVEKLAAEPDSEIVFDKVLALCSDSDVKVGKPYLEGVSVKCQVVSNGRTKKVDVYKQLPRKAARKHNTHRQSYTLVKVNEIIGG